MAAKKPSPKRKTPSTKAKPAKTKPRPAKTKPRPAKAKATKAKPKPTRAKASPGRVGPMAALDRALAALGDDYREFWCMEQLPSAAQIARAEKELGRKLPADYRRFVEHRGALILDVDPAIWRQPVAYEVRPAWQMDFGRVVFGVLPPGQKPAWLSVVQQARELSGRGAPDDFLPVMRRLTGNGDVYGFDADDAFCCWSHETDELRPTDPFLDTLLEEIESLRADRERLRETPIPPAPDPEEEDDRTRHVLIFKTEPRPDHVLSALRSFGEGVRKAFPDLEIIGTYDDAPWDITGDLPTKLLDGDESLYLELVYARRGKVRDAFEIYLAPQREDTPVPRLEGLELMFRTVAPPEVDRNAAQGIAWLRAALDAAGLKVQQER